VIRPATPADREAIVAVTSAAFDGEEKALRIVREVEPEIALVADEEGEVVGHVMLSRMRMGELRPLQLSPLSVAPAWQRRGIGSALTREALRLADEAGEPFVLLLGHPWYYPRFGFEPAVPLGIYGPQEYGDAWMLARLRAYDPSMRGTVEFPPAFD
jgi:predicted N-acetyltransferase YhbS